MWRCRSRSPLITLGFDQKIHVVGIKLFDSSFSAPLILSGPGLAGTVPSGCNNSRDIHGVRHSALCSRNTVMQSCPRGITKHGAQRIGPPCKGRRVRKPAQWPRCHPRPGINRFLKRGAHLVSGHTLISKYVSVMRFLPAARMFISRSNTELRQAARSLDCRNLHFQ